MTEKAGEVSYPSTRRIIRDARTGVQRRENQRVISPADLPALGQHAWDCMVADAEGKPRPEHPKLSFDRVERR